MTLKGNWRRIHDLKIKGDTLWVAGTHLLQGWISETGDLQKMRHYTTQGRELTCITTDPVDGSFYAGTNKSGLFRIRFNNNKLDLQQVVLVEGFLF